MKSSTVNNRSYYTYHRSTPDRYPNCAKIYDLRGKIVDALLAAAIAVGFVAVVLFMLVL